MEPPGIICFYWAYIFMLTVHNRKRSGESFLELQLFQSCFHLIKQGLSFLATSLPIQYMSGNVFFELFKTLILLISFLDSKFNSQAFVMFISIILTPHSKSLGTPSHTKEDKKPVHSGTNTSTIRPAIESQDTAAYLLLPLSAE